MWLVWAVVARAEGSAEDRAADRACVSRMAAGDHEAVADLYDRHARAIYSLALRILQHPADAEDVVQDVFEQAWRQASRYDATRGVVAAWLLTLARSRAIDRLRARRTQVERRIDEVAGGLADTGALPDAETLTVEQVARVRAALDTLPLLQRLAIELAYYEGLTHVEIAERLEQPLGTVKTRIRLALARLRDTLAGLS